MSQKFYISFIFTMCWLSSVFTYEIYHLPNDYCSMKHSLFLPSSRDLPSEFQWASVPFPWHRWSTPQLFLSYSSFHHRFLGIKDRYHWVIFWTCLWYSANICWIKFYEQITWMPMDLNFILWPSVMDCFGEGKWYETTSILKLVWIIFQRMLAEGGDWGSRVQVGGGWVMTVVQDGDYRCLNKHYDVEEDMEMGNSSLMELIRLTS